MFGGFAPMIPGIVVTAAVVIVAGVALLMRLNEESVMELMFSVAIILLGVVFTLAIVGSVCMNIHPYERFDNPVVAGEAAKPAVDSMEKLVADVTTTEADVCKYLTRSDQLIQNNVGPPGQNDPNLVAAAIQDARSNAKGPLTECSSNERSEGNESTDKTQPDPFALSVRIAKMGRSVGLYTGPTIMNAFDKLDTCKTGSGSGSSRSGSGGSGGSGVATNESFDDMPAISPPSLSQLRFQLKQVQDAMAKQKKWLDAIDAKTDALSRGELSDCDKQAGSQAAQTSVVSNPSAGT
jgi:hypothetical protein